MTAIAKDGREQMRTTLGRTPHLNTIETEWTQPTFSAAEQPSMALDRKGTCGPLARDPFEALVRSALSNSPLVRQRQSAWDSPRAARQLAVASIEKVAKLDRALCDLGAAVADCNLIGAAPGMDRKLAIANTFEIAMRGAPRLEVETYHAIATRAPSMGEQLRNLFNMAATTKERFAYCLRAMEERGIVGKYVNLADRDVVAFRHGRTTISHTVVSSQDEMLEHSSILKGLVLNRQINDRTHIQNRVVEVVLRHEDHTQVLWQPVMRPVSAAQHTPARIEPVLLAMPSELAELAVFHTADHYTRRVDVDELRRYRAEHVETTRSRTVVRTLNTENLAKAGLAVGAGIGAVGLLVSLPLIGLVSAASPIDPCITIADFVVCGWVPEECDS